jgi:signal transduction histidine kinase
VTRSRSLIARLLVHLLLVQFGVIVGLWLLRSVLLSAGLIGALGYSFDDYFSYYRIRDYVVRSLVKAPDGSLRIEPVSELAFESERRPQLKYSVLTSMSAEPLPGSSAELTAALQRITSVDARGMAFFLPGDSSGKNPGELWRWNTPYGPLLIAVSGFAFDWSDVYYAFANEIGTTGLTVGALFAVSALVTALIVYRGLAPLRRAAEAADAIDLDTIGPGLPVAGAPSEVRPLVDSINRALVRLDASAARMRRYTASAAHELRTPLAVLAAHIEDPPGPGYKTTLERDVARMRIIVDQILASARLIEGQAPSEQIVDLVRVARSIVGDCAPLANKAGRRIELDANVASVAVRGNRQAIECILANLVDNALRAEPEGGVVIVQVGPKATMTVVDHGPGVREEDRADIFEPFWRKDEHTPGAGLGLSITKDLVSRHGGRILVGDTPGGGATFEVVFAGG